MRRVHRVATVAVAAAMTSFAACGAQPATQGTTPSAPTTSTAAPATTTAPPPTTGPATTRPPTAIGCGALVKVPNVVGRTEKQARQVLEKACLHPDVQYVQTGQRGRVTQQVPPAGQTHSRGGSVVIFVAR
jgi:hypothetical protein